uniref:Uncharacterized protein n=1 Tax=Tanacetum cinerariifolium TaxID=118510 RepID=A0A6L2MEB0_TANCI|nr:hypothetical protein [Tanacetum cinerariifolium]GEY93989.1 hypothetical protein [Tanacetum cinerariifolium]
MNVRDTEDILDDATKSQMKMKKNHKIQLLLRKKQNVWTIDYKKLNALYEDFVPQKEFYAEEKYFSSSFISLENSSNASLPYLSSETKLIVKPMPSANPMLVDLNKMENVFKTLFELLQTNSKRESIFYTSPEVVKIILWIVDSRCSKHMTGDRSLLKIFVEKFTGTVRFGNDHFVAITGYGNYVQGNISVCYVYYVEGLRHNLFRDDLLIGDHESNFYTISISDMAASSPVCLMSKAASIKSWLWHRRLSHLNFVTINDLTKHDLVDGLPKFKYVKDHLCSTCNRGKSKKASHPPKVVPKFLWPEAVSTAFFTQNRSVIHTRYNKTPYELLYGRKPNVEYFYVFALVRYPTNNLDDLGKMKPKVEIESMNIPSKEDLDNLFGPMYETYFEKRSSDTSINSAAP